VRDEEDAFSTEVFQSLRSAYKRGVVHAVRGKSKEAQAALQAAQTAAEARVERARIAAAREGALARAQEAAAQLEAFEAQQTQARIAPAAAFMPPSGH
jgi:RNase P/RNase MRP subunit POP5